MKDKVRQIKSICGKYTLKYTSHVSRGSITGNGNTYVSMDINKKGKNGAYYSIPYCVVGYSAYAEGMDSRKFFTMRFADCKNGVRIDAYKGNTVIKYYTAIFRVQKQKHGN